MTSTIKGNKQGLAARHTGLKSLVLAMALGLGNSGHAADSDRLHADLDKTRTDIAVIEARLKDYDTQIQDTQVRLRSERDQSYRSMHSAKRELIRQQFEVERLQQGVHLIDQQISLIRTDTDRTIERYESLNALTRGLEASAHNAKLQENAQRIGMLEHDKQPLIEKLTSAQQALADMKTHVPASSNSDINLDDDPAIAALLTQRAGDMAKLNVLRQQFNAQKTLVAAAEDQSRQQAALKVAQTAPAATKPREAAAHPAVATLPLKFDQAPAAGTTPGAPWVFAISGDNEKNIESVLNLKSWVESYGGHYVEGQWNGFGDSARHDTDQFRFEFADKLRQIPPNARIILIGHGRGGGAAIEAATEVAYTQGRSIDLLAVLDPVGDESVRANIVYKTDACKAPTADDAKSIEGYLGCINSAPRRTITSNVKYFYNRWQKEGAGPSDFAPSYSLRDSDGNLREIPSATGRFSLAESISGDQKRVFFDNDKNAHLTLLQQESKSLPNLLVKFMR